MSSLLITSALDKYAAITVNEPSTLGLRSREIDLINVAQELKRSRASLTKLYGTPQATEITYLSTKERSRGHFGKTPQRAPQYGAPVRSPSTEPQHGPPVRRTLRRSRKPAYPNTLGPPPEPAFTAQIFTAQAFTV